MTPDSELEAKRRRTVLWVVGLATLGLIFDGYDLVVYGTVVSTFLRNPNEIGPVTPQIAGALGSYALVGVLVGALLAGTVGDILGRRKVMLTGLRLVLGRDGLHGDDAAARRMFGILRFITGLGVGALVATTGASGLGVRAAGKEEPGQRDHLFRGADRQPDGRAAGHHPARRDRLARDVLDRGAAAGHAAAAGHLQDAGVGGLAGVPRARLDEARAISVRTGVPLPEEAPSAQHGSRRRRTRGRRPGRLRRAVRSRATCSRRWCWA